MKNNFIKICITAFLALSLVTLVGCELARDGEDGLSAYDIAVRYGYKGTEAEWIESLKGADGQSGTNGTNGKDGQNGAAGEKGDKGDSGEKGDKGDKGDDGVGIADVKFDAEGNLIVTLTNGNTINAGNPDKYGSDTSDKAPVLSETQVNLVQGSVFIVDADRPYCKYESSDTSVLRVTDDGVMVALTEGKATVTVTARDGKSSLCEVNVVCFEYVTLDDGTLEIKSYGGKSKNIVIPETINGVSVSSIGNSAFADIFEEKLIESVVIPDRVKRIGSYAFSSCVALKSVSFGANVESIGNSAFSGCSKLESVILPEKLTVIEGAAFNVCSSLKSINIHDNIKEIGGSAFYGCDSLETVTIGKGVTYIDMFAFGECTSLTSVVIPENVSMLDEYAFSGCTKLENVTFEGKTSYFDNSFEGTPYFDKMDHPGVEVFNDFVWATGNVSIRTAPSLDSTVFDYASTGDKFFRVGTVEAEEIIWAKVEIDGEYYYISMKYLSTVEVSA